jgi:transposase
MRHRRADQRRELSRLRRADPGADPEARRHRHDRQSRLRAAIRSAGARLRFLPPYSPDLNPIEQVFAKLKTLLRKAQERTVEAVWRRIGMLLATFSPDECLNYLHHAGYGSSEVGNTLAAT